MKTSFELDKIIFELDRIIFELHEQFLNFIKRVFELQKQFLNFINSFSTSQTVFEPYKCILELKKLFEPSNQFIMKILFFPEPKATRKST